MLRSEAGPIILLLDSSGLGGIETHVATLAASLRASGRECHILFLAAHGENPFYRQLEGLALPFTVLDGRIRSLWRWLGNAQPSILHTHGYKAGLIGRLVASARGLAVVSTFHAGERAPLPVGLYQRLDEWTSFLAERITVSAPIANKLPFASTLIHNFIRIPEAIAPVSRVPRIAFVGRLSHEKAPDRFCAMARQVQSCASFHIYGDGPMRPALEAACGDVVTFHGFRTDMQAVWSEIDLLVIPSRAEGLPMAALEAIARGIPLIATDVGALSSVIGDGQAGRLIPHREDAAVIAAGAQSIVQWLDLDEASRRKLSADARNRAIRHFGEGPALDAIGAVYVKAAQRR
jgi:glycosyltransferase involved in cell wall biosynthesis